MLPDFSDAAVLCVADATGAMPGTVQGCWLAACRHGSLDALDLDALAGFQRVPGELVRRIVAAFRLIRTVLGERSAPAADSRPAPRRRAVDRRRQASAPRMRALRSRRAPDPRQLTLLLPLPAPKPRSVTGVTYPEKSDTCQNAGTVSGVTYPAKSTAYHRFPLIERSLEDSDSLANAVLKGGEPKSLTRKDASKRFALFARPPPEIMRAKRENLIVTLRRWARFAPELADDARLPRLAMLDRAAAALDNWEAGRTAADKVAFEALARDAARRPLDLFTVAQIRAAERGMATRDPGLDQIMAKAGWFHGKAA